MDARFVDSLTRAAENLVFLWCSLCVGTCSHCNWKFIPNYLSLKLTYLILYCNYNYNFIYEKYLLN